MEGFNEQVVKRTNKIKQLMIKILAVFLLIAIPLTCVLISQITTPYLVMIGFFLFVGGIYGVWYTFTSQNVEYEYSVVSDTLEIAKVISLRRRKKMCSVPIKEIELLEKGDKTIKNMNFSKTYFAVKDIDKPEDNYFAVFKSPAYGRCLLAFCPNEQILQGMKPHMKKELMLKLFYHKSV